MARLFVISPCDTLQYGEEVKGAYYGKYFKIKGTKYDLFRFSKNPPPPEERLNIQPKKNVVGHNDTDDRFYKLERSIEMIKANSAPNENVKNTQNNTQRMSEIATLAKEYNAEAFAFALLAKGLL